MTSFESKFVVDSAVAECPSRIPHDSYRLQFFFFVCRWPLKNEKGMLNFLNTKYYRGRKV